jgi:hypothetical protein
MEVFDGTGVLSASAAKALKIIAEAVAGSLRDGGDASHHAIVWEGPHVAGTPPLMVPLPDPQSLVAWVGRLLDPYAVIGGDIRSIVNCRAVTFGQDGEAMLCLRHEDAAPRSLDPALVTVTEASARLTETDLFDGGWPSS